MNSSRAACLLLVLPMLPASGQELPRKEPGEIIEGLPNLEAMASAPPPAPVAPSVEQAAAQLESAKKKQARWEKLARQGVLSQAEAERTVLEVSTALVRCQRARLAQAQAVWEGLQARPEPALLAAAAAALASTRELTATAEAQHLQTRLHLAQVTVDRFQRLYAERLIGRGQLERAQAALAAVKAQAPASER